MLAGSVLARIPGLALRRWRSTAVPARSSSTPDAIVNPDKLRHLGPVGDFRALVRSAT